MMTKREIRKLIFLTGRSGSYQVINNMPGCAIVCHVSSIKIGNAIVRALRELAEKEMNK